jgi:hypothetical protein
MPLPRRMFQVMRREKKTKKSEQKETLRNEQLARLCWTSLITYYTDNLLYYYIDTLIELKEISPLVNTPKVVPNKTTL